MTPMLRYLRAAEHWIGNSQVGLWDIIYRPIEQGVLGNSLGGLRYWHDPGWIRAPLVSVGSPQPS